MEKNLNIGIEPGRRRVQVIIRTRGESKYDLHSCCSPKTGHRGREQMSGDYRQKASYRLPRKLL